MQPALDTATPTTKFQYDNSRSHLVRIRALKFKSEGDSTELHLDDLFSTAMSKVTYVPPDQPAEKIQNGTSPVIGAIGERGGQLSRTPSTYGYSPILRTSPRIPDLDPITRPLSPVSWNAEGSTTADGSSPTQWSSAVGRATTGKSGRVIERIQAENDRLRRELKLEILRREEEQKKSEVARGQLQSLQTTHANIAQMRDLDLLSLARKERKLQELRSEFEGEQARRADAENQLKQHMRASERVEEELKAKLREESERAARATTQYDVLSSSWKQMDDDYRRRTEKLQAEFARLRLEAAEDRKKLDLLEITVEQHKHEVEKMRIAKERLTKKFEAYKMEAEESTRAIKERAKINEENNQEALAETLKVLGQMRHVINLKKYVRDTD